MKRKTSVLFLVLCIIASLGFVENRTSHPFLTAEEEELFNEINSYRKKHSLSEIKASEKLSKVAWLHAQNLQKFHRLEGKEACNMHSWYADEQIEACCYTDDHKNMECMHNKPAELADYKALGYEISYWSSDGARAVEALNAWKSSPAHNIVLLNKSAFKSAEWKAVGIGIYQDYICVWFGEEED